MLEIDSSVRKASPFLTLVTVSDSRQTKRGNRSLELDNCRRPPCSRCRVVCSWIGASPSGESATNISLCSRELGIECAHQYRAIDNSEIIDVYRVDLEEMPSQHKTNVEGGRTIVSTVNGDERAIDVRNLDAMLVKGESALWKLEREPALENLHSGQSLGPSARIGVNILALHPVAFPVVSIYPFC